MNVGSKLAGKILSSNTNFESYLPNITTSILGKPLNEKELKDAFFALKKIKFLVMISHTSMSWENYTTS